MEEFLRKLYKRKYISSLLVLVLIFSIIAPGFAQAASDTSTGPQLTFSSSGQTFNTIPVINVNVSSNNNISNTGYTVILDGQSVSATFKYNGTWVDDGWDYYYETDYTSGTLSYTPSSLSEGTHTLQVTAKDSAGNTTTNQWTFNYLTKPSLSEPSPADGAATKDNSGFSVKLSSNGGTINQSSIVATLDSTQIPVNYDASTEIVSYKPGTPIPDGQHTVKVTVSNTSGLSNSLTWSYTIKNVGPSLTFSGSGQTFNTIPNLTVTSSSNINVSNTGYTVTIDGQPVSATFKYNEAWVDDDWDSYYETDYTSGTLTYTSSSLSEGTHTLQVTAKDSAGNTTTNQWTFNYLTKPSLSEPSPANGVDIKDNSGFSVKVSSNGGTVNQSSIVATLDNTQIPVSYDASTGIVSYKSSTPIPDGQHTVKVTVSNTSGLSNSLTWSYTIKNVGPSLTFSGSGQTFNTIPTLTVTSSSNINVSSTGYTVTIDGQPESATFKYNGVWVDDDWDSYYETDYTSGTLTYTPSSLSEGTHTLQVTAKDSAGNTTTNQWTFNYLTKPSLSETSPANGVDTKDNSGFSVKVSSNGGTVNQSSIVATLDNVQVPVFFDALTGIVSYKPSTPISDGKHTVKVTVSNTSGLSNSFTWTYNIKTVGPTLTFSPGSSTINVNVSSNINISNTGYTVTLDDQPVSATFKYNGTWVDDGWDYYYETDYTSGTLTYSLASMSEGTHNLSVSAKDSLGNTSTQQWNFTTKNNTYIAFTSPGNNSTTSGTLSVVGTTNLIKMNLSATKYGTSNVINIGDKTGANGTWNWDTTKVSDGEYVLTLTGYDSEGNTVISKINVKVQNNAQGLGLDNGGTVDNHIGTVNITNGNFVVSQKDIKLPGRGLGTEVTRVYNSKMETNGALGWGWRISVPELSQYSDGSIIIMDGSGAKHTYSVNDDGSYTRPKGDYDILVKNADGTFALKSKDGSKYIFDLANNKVSKIDKNNNSVVYQYDTNNKLISITDPTNRVTNFSYDSTTGKLISVKDYAARTWNYLYDTNGNLIKITDPLQHSENFTYDTNHQLISVTDAKGNKTNFTYTGNKLTGVTDPAPMSFNTTYSYDGSNNQFVETDAKGNATKYIYDANSNIKSVTDALNKTTLYTYDTNYNVLTKTDALGRVTTNTYDSMGNQLSETDPMNHTITYTYDANNNVVTKTDAIGTVTNYTYNANGNQLTDGTNSHTYNANGTVATETDAKGNTTKYSYDSNGNVILQTDALNNQTQMVYDTAGNNTSATDANGSKTTFTYDALGNMLSVTVDSTTPSSTRYTYDANGNKLTLTDTNGNVTSWAYDALNRVVTETDPGNKVQSTSYDANGNILSKTAADGTVTNYTYDQLNRQVQVKNPDGTVASYQYDAVENRVSMTDSTGTTTYEYDKDGNLTKQTDPTGKVTTYSYNADNHQTGKVVDGKSVTYNYDSQSNFTSMVDGNNLTTGFSYDANKNRTAINYANGTKINYNYDAVNEVTDVSNLGSNGIVIANFHYTYNNSQINTVTDSKGVTSYEYDGQNRLTKITDPTGKVTEYTYDGLGNRTSVSNTVNGVISTTNYSYDTDSNELTKVTNPDGSTISYTYDSNGNTLTKTNSNGITKYEYNSNNQLTKVTNPNGDVIEYAYDGVYKRISKTVNGVGTKYVYDGDQVSEETDTSGNVLARYAYDDKGSPISVTEGGKVYNYQYNGHGDVVALTDSTGNVVSTYAYDVWGNVTGKTGNIDSLYGYNGQFGYVYDKETGYYFLQSRYYDPGTGRFTTKDLFTGFEDDPQSLNQYVYVKNNPLMFIDPTGQFSMKHVQYALKYAFRYWFSTYVGWANAGSLIDKSWAIIMSGFSGGVAGRLSYRSSMAAFGDILGRTAVREMMAEARRAAIKAGVKFALTKVLPVVGSLPDIWNFGYGFYLGWKKY